MGVPWVSDIIPPLTFAILSRMTKKIYIRTFGCQMNEYDSAKMADVLAEHAGAEGTVATDRPEDADIILFNTCSVREKAQEKVFRSPGRCRYHFVQHLLRA